MQALATTASCSGSRQSAIRKGVSYGRYKTGRILAPHLHRRPVRNDSRRRERRLLVRCQCFPRIYHAAVDNRKQRFDVFDALLWAGKIVLARDDAVAELAHRNGALQALLRREPGAALGVEGKRLLSRQPLVRRRDLQAAPGLARDRPIQREPGVEGRHARAVGAEADYVAREVSARQEA
jgi:hypothetical protein